MNLVDWLVVAAGIASLFLVAFAAGRRQTDTREFFLARRSLPGWAVCLSFIATEISAVTIISVPAEAYRANWAYLQMFIGSAAARVAIAFLFIPAFYRFDCTTIYEFLRHRFGPATQYCASSMFFVTRLMASGVRLYAAALGTAVIIGWMHGAAADDESGLAQTAVLSHDRPALLLTIAVFTLVGIGFIAFGGIKAVVWTNVVQALVFIAGGVATVVYLCSRLDGGVLAAIRPALDAGKLRVVDRSFHFADSKALLALVFSGFFTSLAVFGTDQDLMQRLLTVETRRASQRSLLATIAVGLPTVCVFLLVGTLLFVFFEQHTDLPRPADSERILPYFVNACMPPVLKGLLLLTVLMASIDSPLGSLAASFVTDIYRPLLCRGADERHYLLVSRCSVAAFGVILGGLAYAASYLREILWVAFQVFSVTGGSLLGVFLLGLLTNRRGDRGNVAAMIASAIGMAVLMALIQFGQVRLGWTWLIVLGTAATFAIGWLFSRRAPDRQAPGLST